MRIQNYRIPQTAVDNGVLLWQLRTRLPGIIPCGLVGQDVSSLQLQLQVPETVTDAQVEAVITAWSPKDTIPASPPTPAQKAQACIRELVEQAGGWGKLTAKNKDALLRHLASHVLNSTIE